MNRIAALVGVAFVLGACGGGGGATTPPPGPAIATSAASASFSAWTGKTQSPTTISITNGGGGTLAAPSATVQYAAGSGWLVAAVAGAAAPYSLSLTAQPAGLSPGTYSASVRLASSGATAATVSVTLSVTQSWTVFVYGHADHNLTGSLLTDIIEMSDATLAPHVNVIVLADYCAGLLDSRTGEPYKIPWTNTAVTSGAEWYRIRGGGASPELIGTEAELNFDDPAVLRGAVAAAFGSFPADRYGVVMWDHGGSWDNGFGQDWSDINNNPSPGTGMKGGQAAQAVTGGLADAGISGTRPLEFVAFDTCLMAGNEVAYEFRNVAKSYIACAEIDYGNGWNYAPTFGWISSNPTATAASFATNEVNFWDQQHQGGANDLLTRSHVALDTAKFASYADRWKDMVSAMDASATLDPLEIARKQYVVTPGYSFNSNPTAVSSYLDAGLFLTGASAYTSDAGVATAASAANTALTEAIIRSSQGLVRTAAGQKGVHFEMPAATAWASKSPAYKALAWDVHTQWSLLLDALAAASDTAAPVIVTSITNGTNPSAASPPVVLFGSDDPDVVEARVYLAQAVGGALYSYGLVGQALVDPGSAYQFTWAGKVIQLTNGSAVSPITLLPGIDGPTPVYLAPGQLQFQGTTYDALAAIDGESADVIAIYIENGGLWVALALAETAGGTFTPTIEDLLTGSRAAGTSLEIGVTTQTLSAVVLPAATGDYMIVTQMADVWGNWGLKGDAVAVGTPF